jgi:hypothetical protein
MATCSTALERQEEPQARDRSRDGRRPANSGERAVQQCRDEVHDSGDTDCERRDTGDRELVRHAQHPLLVALAPTQAMIRRGRTEECGGRCARNERYEVRVPVHAAQLREPGGERHGEQEREQHLHTWQRDPQLGEQLDEFAVSSAFGRLGRAFVGDDIRRVGLGGVSRLLFLLPLSVTVRRARILDQGPGYDRMIRPSQQLAPRLVDRYFRAIGM